MRNVKTISRLLICFSIGGLIALSQSTFLLAQATQHVVSGSVVSSEDGEALPGANVVVRGTAIGVSTDMAGNFSLAARSASDTLVISFVGFQTLEEPINGRSTVNAVLVPRAILDELVVVGYGTVQRRDVTGSVSSISARDIQEVPILNVQQALQGRAAGVMALSGGHRPGDGTTIRVRGRRSLTATNEPLYIIDGIPFDGNINHINPADIETIDVLKDASATAIYGSRGANGVIIVTTSRGGNFATRVSYSGSSGFSEAIGRPEMMNGAQYAEMKRQANRTAGRWNGPEDDPRIFNEFELQAIASGHSFDFQDLVLNNGAQHNHQLMIQGGDARTRFALSGNFFKEDGITGNQDFNRNSFRVNLDHSISNRIRIGTSTMLTHQVQNFGSNPYGSSLAVNPLSSPYDAEGSMIMRPGADPLVLNPLVNLIEGSYEDERSSLRLFSNIFGEIDLMQNLSYRLNFGPSLESGRQGLFQSALGGERTDRARKIHDQAVRYTVENILNYAHTFNQIHALNLTGLYSVQASSSEETLIESRNLPYESQFYHNIGTGETVQTYGSGLEEWGIMSFMGRANYRLMDRYLLTLTGRWDGSSRLAPGNKWGFFPSAAVAWRILEEPFMANQTLLSDLRLRASYGITGNTGVNPYQTIGRLSRTAYSFGDQPAFGFRPTSIANPNLKWEASAQTNLGLDFGFLADRITGSFEVYETNTSDLLLLRQLPITSGFTSVLENVGQTRNRGFELTLSTRNLSTPDFSWSTDFNFFANREEIVDLYGNKEDDVGNQWFIGQPISVWYDYEKIGIWQLSEQAEATAYRYQPGEIKVRDQNGDGTINQDDRIILGSDMPTLSGGMGNRIRYRNVDLSVFLFGAFGHMIYNQFRVNNNTLQGRYNNLNVDYWTPENPTNEAPRADGSLEFPQFRTTMGYMRGDFLKVRNVQIGYRLPASLSQRMGLQNFRIYANADSPLVFHYLEDNIDPERSGGTISGETPARRLFSMGVNINF